MMFYWFLAFLILLFIELVTINLVSIWFALGSLAAMLATCVTDNFAIQTVVFAVVSAIGLIATKPFVKKIRRREIQSTNLDRVIGKIGEVTKEITDSSYGEVKVLGSIWTATSEEPIEKGSKVVVKQIEGVKLIVEKEEEK